MIPVAFLRHITCEHKVRVNVRKIRHIITLTHVPSQVSISGESGGAPPLLKRNLMRRLWMRYRKLIKECAS